MPEGLRKRYKRSCKLDARTYQTGLLYPQVPEDLGSASRALLAKRRAQEVTEKPDSVDDAPGVAGLVHSTPVKSNILSESFHMSPVSTQSRREHDHDKEMRGHQLRKSRSRERLTKSRSRERSKSRSRERSKKPQSRERSRTSRSRERSKKSQSRERSKKPQSRERSKKSENRERSKKSQSRERSKKAQSRERSRSKSCNEHNDTVSLDDSSNSHRSSSKHPRGATFESNRSRSRDSPSKRSDRYVRHSKSSVVDCYIRHSKSTVDDPSINNKSRDEPVRSEHRSRSRRRSDSHATGQSTPLAPKGMAAPSKERKKRDPTPPEVYDESTYA